MDAGSSIVEIRGLRFAYGKRAVLMQLKSDEVTRFVGVPLARV